MDANPPRIVCPDVLRLTDAGPMLFGNRCRACGEHFFPAHQGCSRCSGDAFDTVDLGNAGTLWSWTVQGFEPKPPYNGTGFVPFAVGYIELPSGLKVESRLITPDPATLRIGMPMRLVLDPYRSDACTYAFEGVAA